MTWKTHVAIGANALWILPLFGPLDSSILILLPVAAIASLLPDIDGKSSKIHYIGGGILGIFNGVFYGKYFHHRGLMHSVFVTVLWFGLLWLIFRQSLPTLPYVFALSYASHWLIDGLNTGVGYLYPFVYIRFALVPKAFRSKVGSPVDTILMFFGLAGVLLFFFLFKDQLIGGGLPIIQNF